MAGFEILDETEPLNPGRYLLNHMYSGMTIYWSGGNGGIAGTDSIVRNNNSQNLKNRATATGGFAGGIANAAQDIYAVAFWGSGNTAHTAYSTVINGKVNSASGNSSIILNGSGNTIRSHYSFIGNGVSNSIGGLSVHSTILGGYLNAVSGYSPTSVIIGGSGNTICSDPSDLTQISPSSVIIGGGNNTIVSTGAYMPIASAIIGGLYNKVSSNYSVAMGLSNIVENFSSVAMGGNISIDSSLTNTFVCSLGGTFSISPSPSPTNRTISLLGDLGEGYAEGGFITGPADIAEMFQFADGNPNNEDRRGLFVSITSGGTIEIGNKNIVGAVSSNPGYVGDAAEMKWAGIYVKDELGSKLFETYKMFTWKNNNNTFKVFQSQDNINYIEYPSPVYPLGVIYYGTAIPNDAKISEFKAFKINPDFNPNQEYEPRSKRKEWVPVGLLGKINVRTAENITGTHVDVDANGMAINGTKYAVIKHIEAYESPFGLVQVFIK